MVDFLKISYGALIDGIEAKKEVGKEDEAALHDAIKAYKQNSAF